MCGIAGVVDPRRRPLDISVVRPMVAALRHRGPDDEGFEQPVPWVALGHRRLSIIDVDGGHQPLSNEDGTVWITFNGEIFNYRELRDELVAKGHRFRTRSDTEVVVHLYEDLGPRCVEKLSGQFAFAIFDGERLFCARDPLGVKPFYYHVDSERFAFASELNALVAMPGFVPEPDVDALWLYMKYRYVPSPFCALRGCRKLGAGEWLLLDGEGRRTVRRYWCIDPDLVEDEPEDGCGERIREELESAVRRQMIADVPVGAFLSGGLDSSSIVALMAPLNSGPLDTTCIGFPEAELDERRFAASVGKHVKSRHVDRVVGPDEAAAAMSEVLDRMDEPLGDPALIPELVLSRLVRERVKVALSGDGGDELFGGYGRYFRALQVLSVPPLLRPFWRPFRKRWKASRDPATWRYEDRGAVDPLYRRYLDRTPGGAARGLFGERLRRRSASPPDDPVERSLRRLGRLPPLARLLAVDLETSVPDYHLARVDRASMQASLEVRVPFLDTAFVERALRLPPSIRLKGGRNKGLLRHAMEGHLPGEIVNRGKRGFHPPMNRWLGGRLATLARETLASSLAVEEGLLDGRGVAAMVRPDRSGKVNGRRIWRVMVLESWLRRIRDGRVARPASPA